MASYCELKVFKHEYLETLLDDFEILKLEICLSADMKILSIEQQAIEAL